MKHQTPNTKLQRSSKHQAPIGCAEWLDALGKAALKRPHSKRFAQFEALGAARQRLECGRFSAALEPCETTVRCGAERSTRFPAPTGRHSIAQGEVLGSSDKHFSSPERARLRRPVCSALSGLESVRVINPGLCPGLSNDGLSGLTDSERRFPNRRGAERSAVPHRAGPLHRADDEDFRKNSSAGKRRGVKRPEGRAPRKNSQSAFTLIELLVVITIIGILAALILTAVSRAKGSAQQTQCVNNVRQLGIGLQAFVANHHTYPLFANVDFAKGEYPEHWNSWIEAMRREGFASESNGMPITEGVWRCPVSSYRWAGELVPSYGYNGGAPFGLGSRWVAGATTLAPPIGESEVVNPSDMMAIGDSFGGGIGLVRKYGMYGVVPPRHHQGKVNVVFCDGHVESQTVKFVFEDTNDVALVRWNRDHQPHREALMP